jgi:predicted acylesterase/phospholipase RssA
LSGGANNGAWEVGVMWGLAHYGNPDEFHWDVITGISAGAINTAGMAGWDPKDIVQTTEYLSSAWLQIRNPDIWREWPEGLKAAVTRQGMLDDSYALKTIQRIIAAKSDYARRVSVAAVDVSDG